MAAKWFNSFDTNSMLWLKLVSLDTNSSYGWCDNYERSEYTVPLGYGLEEKK